MVALAVMGNGRVQTLNFTSSVRTSTGRFLLVVAEVAAPAPDQGYDLRFQKEASNADQRQRNEQKHAELAYFMVSHDRLFDLLRNVHLAFFLAAEEDPARDSNRHF